MSPTRFSLSIASLLCLVFSVEASVVVFDLKDPTGSTGTAGELLESNGTVTLSGLTVSVDVSSTLGVDLPVFFSGTSSAGVNSDGTGDTAAEVDFGETLTFTFDFDTNVISSVSLTQLDLAGVGPSSDDDARLTIDGNVTVLETGVAGFAGGSDTYTPPTPIALLPGTSMTFESTGGNGFGIETFTVSIVAAIPEPTAFAFGGLVASCMAGLVVARHRNRVRNTAA